MSGIVLAPETTLEALSQSPVSSKPGYFRNLNHRYFFTYLKYLG